MNSNVKNNWFKQIFSAPTGNLSSKRVMGVLCTICLCVCLFISAFSMYQPSTIIVESVTILAIGCLGLTSMDIASYSRKNKKSNKIDTNTNNDENID